MRLHTRLARLEKRGTEGAGGPKCGVCGGTGTVEVVIDGEVRPPGDPGDPRRRGCPGCGRVLTILLIESGTDDKGDAPPLPA